MNANEIALFKSQSLCTTCEIRVSAGNFCI